MIEKDCWIALNLTPGLGKTLFARLLKFFGSAENVFKASDRDLRQVDGVGKGLAGEILKFDCVKAIEREKRLAENNGAAILIASEDGYPENLKNIYDPPPVLYIQGEWLERDVASVAVVGTRTPSRYGKIMVGKIAGKLAARGVTVVSGMARGIDSLAHISALDQGGRTVAVVGSGLCVVYPPENLKLRNRIIGQGAIVSEFPMATKPDRGNFPARNRVISGLSLGVLVVEAEYRSGALITTKCALEQGRDVYAVPGNVTASKSNGTNLLIKNGAKLVGDANDVIEEVPAYIRNAFLNEERRPGVLRQVALTEEEQRVVSVIDSEASHIDFIIERSRLSPGKVSALLLKLELSGVVRQLSGKMFVVC